MSSRRPSPLHARSASAPDAIVIGAGHNGLVAANLLADAGWDVLVCEATSHTGGAVRSAEVTAPGYLSDLFSAFYPMSAASPVLSALDLHSYGLQWSHAPAVLAHVFPDDRCAVLSRDLQVTAESAESFHAGDGDAMVKVIRQWESIEAGVVEALFQPFPPVMPAQRLVRQIGVGELLRLARLAALPVRRFGEENFRGEGAAMLFAGNALHADLSPDGAGSALYGWLLTMLGHTKGFPTPVGGAGRLADALVARLKSRGGVIRCDAPVREVRISAGIATGVTLASGEVIEARRAVLADVPAPNLFRDLVGDVHLPARMVEDLDRFQWDTSTLKIDWALSSRIPWTAREASKAGTVHLGADMDGLTDYAADLSTRRAPQRPFVLFGQMTTSDPTRSPDGTESCWAYTHLPRALAENADCVAEQVERVTALLEQHAPGFGASIVGRSVQSPATLEQQNPALVGGAINGGTGQLHQQLIFRPVPGLGGASTPIDRLFLAGSSAHPGGGVHGGPGSNAAKAALARSGLFGGARRRVTKALLDRVYVPSVAAVSSSPSAGVVRRSTSAASRAIDSTLRR
jgi:phytoene dehydrogenase-like protein